MNMSLSMSMIMSIRISSGFMLRTSIRISISRRGISVGISVSMNIIY